MQAETGDNPYTADFRRRRSITSKALERERERERLYTTLFPAITTTRNKVTKISFNVLNLMFIHFGFSVLPTKSRTKMENNCTRLTLNKISQ